MLQRLRDEASQTEIAKALGMHKSTVSRLVNEHGPSLLRMAAYLGFKFADADALLVQRDEFKVLTRLAVRSLEKMAHDDKAPR